jgi:hypothetical protein
MDHPDYHQFMVMVPDSDSEMELDQVMVPDSDSEMELDQVMGGAMGAQVLENTVEGVMEHYLLYILNLFSSYMQKILMLHLVSSNQNLISTKIIHFILYLRHLIEHMVQMVFINYF